MSREGDPERAHLGIHQIEFLDTDLAAYDTFSQGGVPGSFQVEIERSHLVAIIGSAFSLFMHVLLQSASTR